MANIRVDHPIISPRAHQLGNESKRCVTAPVFEFVADPSPGCTLVSEYSSTVLLIVVRMLVVIWECPSGIFYILVSVSRLVSSKLKPVSIVEYYLKKTRHFVKLCKLESRSAVCQVWVHMIGIKLQDHEKEPYQ
jgi:hypothetical protein